MGMLAVDYKEWDDVVLKALDNYEASIQQDNSGKNIGMMAAINRREKATLKALDNPVASVQQSKYGMNIGMYAASKCMVKPALKALENVEARKQVNVNDNTILDIAEDHNLNEVIEGYKEILERENQKSDFEEYQELGFED